MGNGEDVMTTYTSSSDPPAVERDGTYVHGPAVGEAKWVLGGGREGYRPRSFAGKRERKIAGNLRGFFIWGECCMYCGAVSRPILPYLLVRELAVGGPLLARI